ncbi:MAG: FliM/FliN family flagellar motor switch protein [Acidimicrobiales bacterium]|jgi:flagellar motor switch protein FliM
MTVVRTHDFHRTETLDRQYVPALNAAFDTFARRGSVELSTSLRRATQLTVSSLQEMSWREVTALLGERPYLMTFNLEPLGGTAMLSLSLGTVVRMLDFRLGGGTQPAFAGHSDLTDTDFAVLGGVITPLLAELADSLSRVKEVSAVPVSQESSIQFVQMAGPNEMFLVSRFQLCVAEDEPVEIILALPFALVRQITEAMRSSTRALNDATSLVDESVVTQANLDVWLELPSVRLPSTEVSELKVGDVIRFFHPLRQPLDLRAEGVLVARALQGAVGSKVVCSILEEVSNDDD